MTLWDLKGLDRPQKGPVKGHYDNQRSLRGSECSSEKDIAEPKSSRIVQNVLDG